MSDVKVYYDRRPVMLKIGPLGAWKVGDEVTVSRPEGDVPCRVEQVEGDGMATVYPLSFIEASDDEKREMWREYALNTMGGFA